jgi:hypothetical protein
MARGLTNEANYVAIANAIRQKNGGSDTYAPAEMPNAILEIETGVKLDPLSNPATSQQILSGYEAYDSSGNLLSGTAFLTGGVANFTLLANNWNGTTYTVTTNNWTVVDGQTPLMDLPFTSSSVNAQRVIEAGITMPYVNSSGTSTTLVFSAIRTPPVDVDVSVFNITEVSAS